MRGRQLKNKWIAGSAQSRGLGNLGPWRPRDLGSYRRSGLPPALCAQVMGRPRRGLPEQPPVTLPASRCGRSTRRSPAYETAPSLGSVRSPSSASRRGDGGGGVTTTAAGVTVLGGGQVLSRFSRARPASSIPILPVAGGRAPSGQTPACRCSQLATALPRSRCSASSMHLSHRSPGGAALRSFTSAVPAGPMMRRTGWESASTTRSPRFDSGDLAVGFAAPRRAAPRSSSSYWDIDNLRSRSVPSGAGDSHCFISGTGDGGPSWTLSGHAFTASIVRIPLSFIQVAAGCAAAPPALCVDHAAC